MAEANPSTNPRQRARSARRQLLLEAAEAVFSERGFSRATMSAIASRAGYSAGNLYNSFENKEALFIEVLTTRATQILGLVHRTLHSEGTVGEIVDRYIDAILTLVQEYRGFFVMLTQTSPDFDWYAAGQPDEEPVLRSEIDHEVVGLFTKAIERGEIPRADPRSYACLLQGTMNAHMARWVRTGGGPEELLRPIADLRATIHRALGLSPGAE
jgi:AcrR family transcriptional regulator